jgi:predicted GNAT superfamily acetyltransferase
MIEIRPCQGFAELEACVQLQIETWGYDPSDVIPRKAFRVAESIGGQVLGAFDTALATPKEPKSAGDSNPKEGSPEALVAFALSIPGVKVNNGKPAAYMHSHMLAVKAPYRNRGLGARMKREQRREALSRGITHMEWTFDPLEIKNAHLNIHRLGAIARTYRVDFYGLSSSQLQGGLPTDRLVAEWELNSPRVKATLEGNPAASRLIEERITVPAAIYQWKATEADRERALAVQLENRRTFQQAFLKGLAVVGFSLDAAGNGTFELGPTGADEAD